MTERIKKATFAGFKIKGLRISARYTAVFVAERLDITPTYLSLIESGKRKPSKKVIAKASQLFDVDAKDFQQCPEFMKHVEDLEKKIGLANLIAILEFMNA